MTTAEYIPLNGGVLFEVSGHAGYGKKGEDIVCAGITALCMALLSTLEELKCEKDIEIINTSTADAYLSVEIAYTDNIYSEKKTECVFMTVINGLKAIEGLYPDNLSVTCF